MSKNGLRDKPMSEAAFVDRAADWGRRLSQAEARGPGDLENAWRRLEARYGIPWRTFWTLRYRPPPSITAYLFERLRSAYQAECDRQMRKMAHELEVTRRIAGPDHAAVVAAQAVVDKVQDQE